MSTKPTFTAVAIELGFKQASYVGASIAWRPNPPADLKAWVDRVTSVLRPRCSIDAVIGSASEIPLSENFLPPMRIRWFGRD